LGGCECITRMVIVRRWKKIHGSNPGENSFAAQSEECLLHALGDIFERLDSADKLLPVLVYKMLRDDDSQIPECLEKIKQSIKMHRGDIKQPMKPNCKCQSCIWSDIDVFDVSSQLRHIRVRRIMKFSRNRN
jgi:hypothetical protein